ncbi:calcium-binding protein, partial [Variovorax sp. JS1663]|uniref:calcium-binding protein n=1 Tax=Variovorax sp. JS1663 TaxID=1851577 RepID=UPI00117BE65E
HLENLTLTGTGHLNGTGNALANLLTGNAGDNVLNGGIEDAAIDTLIGGAGNDTYLIYGAAADTIVENAGEGIDTVVTDMAYTLGANLENLALSGTSSYSLTGNAVDNVLTGNAGANVLNGAAGADTMIGQAGNDTYVVDNAGDVVTESAGGGTDTVQSSVSYTLQANVENLAFTGGGNLNGTGNALANTLTGNFGGNVLDGGAGADTMIGGAGNDTYVVDNVGDVVTENAGEGTDLVQSSITYSLGANLEKLTLTGTGHLSGTGNALANTLLGNAGNNVLDGGAGADTMAGGAGNDTYVLDNAGDIVTENANEGTDTVQSGASHQLGANVENLTFTGTGNLNGTGNEQGNVLTGNEGANGIEGMGGNDVLYGAGGNDMLDGGEGNDVLDGAAGSDVLRGGGGDDSYRFGRGGGADRIVDNAGTADELVFSLTGGAAGRVDFKQLWFSHQQGTNELTITVMGSTDSMKIDDWYAGAPQRVESIVAAAEADGTSRTLASTDVELLVNAMASMAPASGATSWAALTSQQQQQLQTLGVWR